MSGGTADSLLHPTQVEDASTKGSSRVCPSPRRAWCASRPASTRSFEASYEREARRMRAAFEDLDLGILTDDGVATAIRDLQRFLDRTGSVMLSCASNALGSFVARCACSCSAWVDGDRAQATSLAADVTAGGAGKGLGDLESARPTIALARIAEIALRRAGRTPRRCSHEPLTGPAGGAKSLEAVPKDRRARRSIAGSWRTAIAPIREAELSTPRWREDQSFPLATLALYVSAGSRRLCSPRPLDEVLPPRRRGHAEARERSSASCSARRSATSWRAATSSRVSASRCARGSPGSSAASASPCSRPTAGSRGATRRSWRTTSSSARSTRSSRSSAAKRAPSPASSSCAARNTPATWRARIPRPPSSAALPFVHVEALGRPHAARARRVRRRGQRGRARVLASPRARGRAAQAPARSSSRAPPTWAGPHCSSRLRGSSPSSVAHSPMRRSWRASSASRASSTCSGATLAPA